VTTTSRRESASRHGRSGNARWFLPVATARAALASFERSFYILADGGRLAPGIVSVREGPELASSCHDMAESFVVSMASVDLPW
jgi:hypothetical protein